MVARQHRLTRVADPSRAGSRRLVGRHWLIITLLVVGIVLRVFAWFAYQPA